MGGVIARGNYAVVAENHGKRAYKRDTQVNDLDVMLYYWDERDGPSFCGWWFGPKVGGDQVWAYHPDRSLTCPPTSGWKVPYDGPVDPTFLIEAVSSSSASNSAPASESTREGNHDRDSKKKEEDGRRETSKKEEKERRKKEEDERRQKEEARKAEEAKRKQEEENKRKAEEAERRKREEELRLMDAETR